jgi:hypothetical protein
MILLLGLMGQASLPYAQQYLKLSAEVGPGGDCWPRHRMPVTFRNEGSKCVG